MIDTATARIYEFDSIREYARFLQNAQPQARAGHSSVKTGEPTSWDGGWDYDRALECAMNGGRWPEGASKIRMALGEQLTLVKKAPLREQVLGVIGHEVEPALVAAGIPHCVWETVESDTADQKGAPVLRIGVNASYWSGVAAQTIMNRGAAILACIDELENIGYRVELVSSYCSDSESSEMGGREWYCNVVIKRAGEQWSADAAAFALAHPAYCRRLGFRAKEQCSEGYRMTRGGYGAGDDIKGESFDLWFPRLNSAREASFSTPERAFNTIRAVVLAHHEKQLEAA